MSDDRWGKAADTAKAVERLEAGKQDKSDYKRLTITLPPVMYDRIIDIMADNKKKGKGGDGASGIVREALYQYFKI